MTHPEIRVPEADCRGPAWSHPSTYPKPGPPTISSSQEMPTVTNPSSEKMSKVISNSSLLETVINSAALVTEEVSSAGTSPRAPKPPSYELESWCLVTRVYLLSTSGTGSTACMMVAKLIILLIVLKVKI